MQKIAIAFFAIFPFEGIRREVENIAGCAVQSAAVDGKVAACGIIGNQVIGRGSGRVGVGGGGGRRLCRVGAYIPLYIIVIFVCRE